MKLTFLTEHSFAGYRPTLLINPDYNHKFDGVLTEFFAYYNYGINYIYAINYSKIYEYDLIILVDESSLGNSLKEISQIECKRSDTDILRLIANWANIPVIFLTNLPKESSINLSHHSTDLYTVVSNEKDLILALNKYDIKNFNILLVKATRTFALESIKYLTKTCLRILNEF